MHDSVMVAQGIRASSILAVGCTETQQAGCISLHQIMYAETALNYVRHNPLSKIHILTGVSPADSSMCQSNSTFVQDVTYIA